MKKMIKMGYWVELFFSRAGIDRLAKDAPIVFVAVLATTLSQDFVQNNGFSSNTILIIIITFVLTGAIILLYAIIAMLIRKIS